MSFRSLIFTDTSPYQDLIWCTAVLFIHPNYVKFSDIILYTVNIIFITFMNHRALLTGAAFKEIVNQKMDILSS